MSLNNIRRQALKPGKTVPLVLNMLTGDPVLHVEHLGQTNYAFVNDSLRGAGAEGVKAVAKSKGSSSPEQLALVRIANRETIVTHSVRKIEGFFYDGPDGEPDKNRPVPSTPAGIAEIVNALPDDVFDVVMMFVINQENFRDVPMVASPEDLAKK